MLTEHLHAGLLRAIATSITLVDPTDIIRILVVILGIRSWTSRLHHRLVSVPTPIGKVCGHWAISLLIVILKQLLL